jgi:LEA14-like dessication related protein
MKALESVFLLELRVFNTNDIPIVIKGIDCELDINDKRFASGVSNKETEIPSYGSGIIPILVYSSVLDIFRGVMGMSSQEKLSYQIKGKVRIDTGTLGPTTVPFKSQGELSFDRFTN